MDKNKKKKFIDNQSQINELKDQLARSLADYSNLEKRIETQRQIYVTLATTSIVDKMLIVLDDFQLAQSHLNDNGLKIALDKFLSVLKTEGVEEIEAINKEFDPSLMDCIEVAEGKQNHVVAVRRPGYKLNGQVIRPAQVVVGKSDN